jgi:hypothetical protein
MQIKQGTAPMALVNLTPHEITIYGPEGILKLPASGQLCRVRNNSQNAGECEGIPLIRARFEAVTGLPEPDGNSIFIVSSIVLQALASKGLHRADLAAPATGPNDGAVRDVRNQVQAVTKLLVM